MARTINTTSGGGESTSDTEGNIPESDPDVGDETTRELKRDADSDPMRQQTESVPGGTSESVERQVRERDNTGSRGSTDAGTESNSSSGGGPPPSDIQEGIEGRSNQGARGTSRSNETDFASNENPTPEVRTGTAGVDGGPAGAPTETSPPGAPETEGPPSGGPDQGGYSPGPGSDVVVEPVSRNRGSGGGGGGSKTPDTQNTGSSGGGFDGQGVENSSGPNADRAETVEQGVLDTYSFLDADDVRVVTEERDGGTYLVPEFSESARREIARRDIASQLDEQYSAVDIGPGDVTITDTGEGYSGSLTSDAVDDINAAYFGGGEVDNKAESVSDIQSQESGGAFISFSDGADNAREAVADVQERGASGEFFDVAPARTAADENPGSQAAKAVDEQATRVSNLDFAEFKQLGRKGKVGGSGFVVGGPAAGRFLQSGGVERQPKTGRAEAEDLNWSAAFDQVEELTGLDVPFGGNPARDEVEQGVDRAASAYSSAVNFAASGAAAFQARRTAINPSIMLAQRAGVNVQTTEEARVDPTNYDTASAYAEAVQEQNERVASRTAGSRFLAGSISGALQIGNAPGLAKTGMEATEYGGEFVSETAEGDAGKFVTESGQRAGAAATNLADYATENPARFAGSAAGALAASYGVMSAVPKTRFLIQPGEEAAGYAGGAAFRGTSRTLAKAADAAPSGRTTRALDRASGGADRAGRALFPNNEPVILSEETALRGAQRLAGGVKRAGRRARTEAKAARFRTSELTNWDVPTRPSELSQRIRREVTAARFKLAEIRSDDVSYRSEFGDDRGQASLLPPRQTGVEVENETETAGERRRRAQRREALVTESDTGTRTRVGSEFDARARTRSRLETNFDPVGGVRERILAAQAQEATTQPAVDTRITDRTRPRFDIETLSETRAETELESLTDTRQETRTELGYDSRSEIETELELESKTETETELEGELLRPTQRRSGSKSREAFGDSWTFTFEGIDPLTGEY